MPKFQESITSEEVNELPVGAFHGEIVVVDTPQAIVEACEYLSSQPLIGYRNSPLIFKGSLQQNLIVATLIRRTGFPVPPQ